ncbi:MAG TPA: hypothetical protein PKY87_10520 [Terricaulis sp.]|nr:hypothetical protein [Terricaulis sp.]
MREPAFLRTRVIAFLLALTIGGCGGGDEAERYLILETAPFYQADLPHNAEQTDAVIAAVRSFSEANSMELILAYRSLGPGEFNVTAANESLNLSATHINQFGSTMNIRATSRGEPSDRDRALLEEFVAEIVRATDGSSDGAKAL